MKIEINDGGNITIVECEKAQLENGVVTPLPEGEPIDPTGKLVTFFTDN